MNRNQGSSKFPSAKPWAADSRIPVRAGLELVRNGMPTDTIVCDYFSERKEEDIQACVQGAIDVVASGDLHVTAVL